MAVRGPIRNGAFYSVISTPAARPRRAAPRLLIWPEGAIPVVNFFPLENPEFLNALGAASAIAR